MPPAPPVPSPASRSRAALWVAVALPLLAACAPRDLWAPDEPRYGLVARAILETGDALVPRIDGQPYAEKPPLVFASMAALGALAGGVTAVVARLACAVFAAVAALTTARLARRWFGDPGLGDTAALLFSTTGLVLWNGSRAGLDLPMTCFALLALEAAARSSPAVVRPRAAARPRRQAAREEPHVFYVPVAALVGRALASGRVAGC
jgi:4-amino-4-deoxy-L-arabinose transferase-like glycosyltransferase